MNLVKSKYRSIITDHHLNNLLILATSSVNSNIELLVNGNQRIRIKSGVFHVNASLISHFWIFLQLIHVFNISSWMIILLQ